MEDFVPQYTASDIVVTWYRAVSPAGVGATPLARAEALTQAEFHVVDAALQTPGCRECPWPLSVTKRDVPLSYAVLEKLCYQMEESWELRSGCTASEKMKER